MKKIIGIYKITSPSGRIYIGQSVNILRRFYLYRKMHCKSQPRIFLSLKKYGPDSHIFEIIKECQKNELNDLEIFYIEKYDSLSPTNGLNAKPGGLIGLGTKLDPALTKGDHLIGHLVGKPGTLPDVLDEIELKINLLDRVIGSEQLLRVHSVKHNEKLLLGEGQDSSLYYDGTNMIIEPDEVGSGLLTIGGNVVIDGTLTANGVNTSVAEVLTMTMNVDGGALNAGDPLPFDTAFGEYGTLIVADTVNYEVDLKAGYVYEMEATARGSHSAAGNWAIAIYDETSGVNIENDEADGRGNRMQSYTANATDSQSSSGAVFATLRPASDKSYSVSIVFESNLTSVSKVRAVWRIKCLGRWE